MGLEERRRDTECAHGLKRFGVSGCGAHAAVSSPSEGAVRAPAWSALFLYFQMEVRFT